MEGEIPQRSAGSSGWDLRGICVGLAWGLRGICVGSARDLRGICAGSARDLRGICVGSAWDQLGSSRMELRNSCVWSWSRVRFHRTASMAAAIPSDRGIYLRSASLRHLSRQNSPALILPIACSGEAAVRQHRGRWR